MFQLNCFIYYQENNLQTNSGWDLKNTEEKTEKNIYLLKLEQEPNLQSDLKSLS